RRRKHNEMSSGKAFTEVIVRIALQRQADAVRYECSETLAGRAREADLDCVFRQAFGSITACDFTAEGRADSPICVPDWKLQLDRCFVNKRILRKLQEEVVECFVDAVILCVNAARGYVIRNCGHLENRSQIELFRLPVLDDLLHIEPVAAADHLIDRAE